MNSNGLDMSSYECCLLVIISPHRRWWEVIFSPASVCR